MLLLKLAGLAVSFCGALVFHHWAARRWFGTLDTLSERELLLHGLVAALIINGTAATGLALLHLFTLPAFVVLFTACMIGFREDARATWRAACALGADFAGDLRHLRLMPLLAAAGLLLLAAMLALLARIPTGTVDAWVFQIPLALSLIEHQGFVYPQLGNMFYGNQPLFINLLFAEVMSADAHFVMAGLVNSCIFVFTLVSLAAPWGRRRPLALVMLLLAIGGNFFFTTGVPIPLTDMPRTCLSVLGLTYAALYFDRRIPYYAGLAATCVGAAVASKYTELVALMLVSACLVPLLARQGQWRLLGKCAAIVTAVSAYWYVKNLVLLGNPLYPFLFGHPGLSDEWMSSYMTEMTQAFEPSLRHFSHNMFSLTGWQDFLSIVWQWFFERRLAATWAALMGVAGAVLAPRRVLPLLLMTMFLFVFWYVVMFNHIRWAIPAYMLLQVTGCYALLALLEQRPIGWRLPRAVAPLARPRNLAAMAVATAGLAAAALALRGPQLLQAGLSLAARLGYVQAFEPLMYAMRPGGVDQYLELTRPGYVLYHHIAINNLRRVYQPYDNGARVYTVAYNGGRDGDWFVEIGETPRQLNSVQTFIKDKEIRYFIVRDDLLPIEIERLGPERLAVAARVIDTLKPGAELLVQDSRGWKLYKAGAGK